MSLTTDEFLKGSRNELFDFIDRTWCDIAPEILLLRNASSQIQDVPRILHKWKGRSDLTVIRYITEQIPTKDRLESRAWVGTTRSADVIRAVRNLNSRITELRNQQQVAHRKVRDVDGLLQRLSLLSDTEMPETESINHRSEFDKAKNDLNLEIADTSSQLALSQRRVEHICIDFAQSELLAFCQHQNPKSSAYSYSLNPFNLANALAGLPIPTRSGLGWIQSLKRCRNFARAPGACGYRVVETLRRMVQCLHGQVDVEKAGEWIKKSKSSKTNGISDLRRDLPIVSEAIRRLGEGLIEENIPYEIASEFFTMKAIVPAKITFISEKEKLFKAF